MDNKQQEKILNELKLIKKILAANLYVSGVDSADIGEIVGMDASDIRRLVSKRKMKGGKDAKKD